MRFCWALLFLVFLFMNVGSRIEAATFYVSKNGAGTNPQGGFSTTNWRELNQIVWTLVTAGDTILIDGGSVACPALGPGYNCGMVYNSTLNIGKSGVMGNPITIKLGTGGTVIIDGGLTQWSRCAEYAAEPTPPTAPNGAGVREEGVKFGSQQWVVLDGTKWGGIEIRNHSLYGVNFGSSKNSRAQYLKVHHNTHPTDTSNGAVGVTQGYQSANNTLARSEIFRNGQDAVRGGGDNFTLEENYIHDHYCNHPDGIQAFIPTGNCDTPRVAGLGEITNLTIQRNVFERVGLQPIFLGENNYLQDSVDRCNEDPPNPPGHDAWVTGAEINNNLIIYGHDMIKSKNGKSTNFNVHHNTLYRASGFAVEWCCANPGAIPPMKVENNIFHTMPDGTDDERLSTFGFGGVSTTFNTNCMLGTSGTVPGSNNLYSTDPQFNNVAAGDFSLKATSACIGRGSSITSVTQLLALSGDYVPPTLGPTVPITPSPTIDPAACVSSAAAFTNSQFASQVGTFAYTFEAGPGEGAIDGVIGLSSNPATALSDLAVIVRFNPTGAIDARNGSSYSAASVITYQAGSRYRFKLLVDMRAKTYSALVTTPDGQERVIGQNFAFRTEQAGASQLQYFNWLHVADTDTTSVDSFSVCNRRLPTEEDVTADGKVDWRDVLLLVNDFGLRGSLGFSLSDIVENGVISIFDWNRVIRGFGN